MQIEETISKGDNLHEISKHIFWEKYEKYLKISSAEFFTQHAKL